MTISLGFYLDPNLTSPITGSLTFEQLVDGSTGPQMRTVYVGSSTPNRKFESHANAGVDPIELSIVDSQPGSGQEASNVTLALDPNDMVNRTAGDSLPLPATILSGTTNAIPIYIQVQDATGVVATDTSISLTTNNIVESEYTP